MAFHFSSCLLWTRKAARSGTNTTLLLLVDVGQGTSGKPAACSAGAQDDDDEGIVCVVEGGKMLSVVAAVKAPSVLEESWNLAILASRSMSSCCCCLCKCALPHRRSRFLDSRLRVRDLVALPLDVALVFEVFLEEEGGGGNELGGCVVFLRDLEGPSDVYGIRRDGPLTFSSPSFFSSS